MEAPHARFPAEAGRCPEERNDTTTMRVNGEIDGIRQSTLEMLDSLYDLRLPQDQLWNIELLEILAAATHQINREIAIYLDRKGRITDVGVGDSKTVALAAVDGKRGGRRLSGIRCIHTHPEDSGMLSAVDVSSLKQLRLDAMIAAGVRDGQVKELFVGVASPADPDECDILGPYPPEKEDFSALLEYIGDADKSLRDQQEGFENKPDDGSERVVLVGMKTRDDRELNGMGEAEVSFLELEELARTAGAQVVGKVMQRRDARNAATLIGQGKIEEIRMAVQAFEADTVIFDEELSGAQQRNIEAIVGVKVLDRTNLILDIFAQHARSREGIMQVEHAMLEYRLPRLGGMGVAMSRQGASLGGGLGTRGPGESKLETDKRHIRSRLATIKSQLEDVRRQRGILRSDRKKTGVPAISIVGYTNAGKSTLLNTLTEADVLAEDKLFATLDTTTRKLALPNGGNALLIDTVGFIRKLPHKLLDAFKATLEEVVLSDLLLITADASDPQVADHIRIVDEILTELGAGEKPVLIVLNKVDKLPDGVPLPVLNEDRPVLQISARTGAGMDELKKAIEAIVFSNRLRTWFLIPYHEGAALAWLHENGKVFRIEYVETGTLVQAELDRNLLSRVEAFLAEDFSEGDQDLPE
jgi:GTP-binding protein HflX